MANASRAVGRTLLNAATTGSATYTPRANAKSQQGFHHHIKWASGTTAGVVKIEVADVSTYAGTWAVVATITNDGSGNAYEDYAYTPSTPGAFRHRISTTISGGATPSVTTVLIGTPA